MGETAYEILRLVRGQDCQFMAATAESCANSVLVAIATSTGDIVIFQYQDGAKEVKTIPWTMQENHKPVALAFSPLAEWLLVAAEDGTLFVVPLKIVDDATATKEHLFSIENVTVFPPSCSRAKPTSVVWWQTSVGNACLAILGTELGELSFIDLITGKEVGGTYINVPIKELFLCQDNAEDIVFLLMTSTDGHQWRLVLEHRSVHYLFPLEDIAPLWRGQQPPLFAPRSRLLGLKQMSVEKLHSLKQRLTEAKAGSRLKVVAETKGESGELDTVLRHPTPPPSAQSAVTPSPTAPSELPSGNTTSGEKEHSQQPERMSKFIMDLAVTPHFAKDRRLLAGVCRLNDALMVYSTDLESTPLYIFKIPPDSQFVVLQSEAMFLSDSTVASRLRVVATALASSSKMDGSVDHKVNAILQEVDLPEGEEILALYSCPHLGPPKKGEDGSVEPPQHSYPPACLVLTRSALYVCQTKQSIESMLLEVLLQDNGNIDWAAKLCGIFCVDCKLFNLAADVRLRQCNLAAAIPMYKFSKCPHIRKCVNLCLVEVGDGPVTSGGDFVTYAKAVTIGNATHDLQADERRSLANTFVLCYLYLLSRRLKKVESGQQRLLCSFLLFLRTNVYYDECFALWLMVQLQRWESVQFVSSVRGLQAEKLQWLLFPDANGWSSLQLDESSSTGKMSSGYMHCLSDPQLRHVLLLKPSVARSHMAFVRHHLSILEVPILRRLAALYDPSCVDVRPFLQHSADHRVTAGIQWQAMHAFGDHHREEGVTLEAFLELFIAIVVMLRLKLGWNYQPELLTYKFSIENKTNNSFLSSAAKMQPQIISGGFGHSAVVVNHQLFTWGMADCGVLGHGPRSRIFPALVQPMSAAGGTTNEQLPVFPSSSPNFITSSSGSNISNAIPHDGTEPLLLSYFVGMSVWSVSCGKHHTMALTDNGVYAWGSNKYGQLGTGTSSVCQRPVLISALEGEEVVSIHCGQFHSMAVTADGKLLTWGWGVQGQLGHGDVEDSHLPMIVDRLQGKHVISASGGYAHSVALTSEGCVYAWGCGTYGQLGNGSLAKCCRPSCVNLPELVTILAAGYFHNVVVTKSGIVFSWGCNPSRLRVQAQIQRRARAFDKSTDLKASGDFVPDGHNGDHNVEKNNRTSSVKDGGIVNDAEECDNSDIASEGDSLQFPQLAKNDQSKPAVINTVPSCDPSDLDHLWPRQVPVPPECGTVRQVSCGVQHTLLVTCEGAIYVWGHNVNGQLGTGNRREMCEPTRILSDACICHVACGSDFSLAMESNGQIWGWGSNYYSQLGKVATSDDEKGQAGRVFMLRTTKRVLKLPHSIHSDCEKPIIVRGVPLLSLEEGEAITVLGETVRRQNDFLSRVKLASLESSSCVIFGMDGQDSPVYDNLSLHAALCHYYGCYNSRNVGCILEEGEAYQALATLHMLERRYSEAMRNQLSSVLKQSAEIRKETTMMEATNQKFDLGDNGIGKGCFDMRSMQLVTEAMRIVDHYLHLQTEESQTGMRMVLQEGISMWLSNALPMPQLEDLLLTHLPRTVYPLALLLFGDGTSAGGTGEDNSNTVPVEEDPAMKVLSQLSTKFCLNLCSSVIHRVQTGGASEEYAEALSHITTGMSISPRSSIASNSLTGRGVSPSPDLLPKGGQHRSGEQKRKSEELLHFTCGHRFTACDFQTRVLPRLEESVGSVPGFLGKTARVLLDQYYTDHPEMACPNCMLAHLTIKLTKHQVP